MGCVTASCGLPEDNDYGRSAQASAQASQRISRMASMERSEVFNLNSEAYDAQTPEEALHGHFKRLHGCI